MVLLFWPTLLFSLFMLLQLILLFCPQSYRTCCCSYYCCCKILPLLLLLLLMLGLHFR